ncbi:hypothetical protein D3C87_749810 [compost metagenome]
MNGDPRVLGERPEALDDLLGARGKLVLRVAQGEGPGLDAREVEQVVEQALQAMARRLDLPNEARLIRGQQAPDALLEELGVASDGGERGAKLVGDGVHEVALEAVQLHELLVLRPQGFFQGLALRDVLGGADHGEGAALAIDLRMGGAKHLTERPILTN